MPSTDLEYFPGPLGRLGRGEWRPRRDRDPFGRLPQEPDFDFSDPLQLAAPVGRGRPNGRDDVAKLEGLVAIADGDPVLLERGPTGEFDEAVAAALLRFQRKRRLASPAAVDAGDETMRALEAELRRRAARPLVRIPPDQPQAAAQFHLESDLLEADPSWGVAAPPWRQPLQALGASLSKAPKTPGWPQIGGVRG